MCLAFVQSQSKLAGTFPDYLATTHMRRDRPVHGPDRRLIDVNMYLSGVSRIPTSLFDSGLLEDPSISKLTHYPIELLDCELR
jgi:hypothetical protein